jgi:hypothetical protein
MATVGKWRGRFARQGLDGLHDEPRPGKPRTISDEQVERVITKTLEEQPKDATHWSTRSMAAATGMSQSAVSRIWRAFALKPHQSETFKLSPDPQFIDKVRDIVGLYLNPPEAAVVLCVDEKSQIQALDRTAPVLPLMPGCRSGGHRERPGFCVCMIRKGGSCPRRRSRTSLLISCSPVVRARRRSPGRMGC